MKLTLKVSELPANLPASTDDGACDHLVGRKLPAVELASSTGRIVNMSREGDSVLPDNWDSIPGARGCTPQSCSIRDHQHELAD
jgi:hypothetical protein